MDETIITATPVEETPVVAVEETVTDEANEVAAPAVEEVVSAETV